MPDTGSNPPVQPNMDTLYGAVLKMGRDMGDGFDKVQAKQGEMHTDLAVMKANLTNHAADRAAHPPRPCDDVHYVRATLREHLQRHWKITAAVITSFVAGVVALLFAMAKAGIFGG